MSVKLLINNYGSTNTKELAALFADVAQNDTSLTLKNNQNTSTNDYILLGTPSSERGEIKIVQSVTGVTLVTTAAISFPHLANSPVIVLNGNQIKVYRATNITNLPPDDTAFATFTGSTIDIDPDQGQTIFVDPAGGPGFWYKFTYFNSSTSAETSLADSAPVRGGTVYYCSNEDIRNESGIKSRYVTEAMIAKHERAAQTEVDSAASGHYKIPFTSPVNAAIQHITTVLAAGYLMTAQYDQFTDMSANGQKKIDWANLQLEKIKSGQLQIIGANGQPVTSSGNSTGFSGYPNAETAADTNCAEDFMFQRDAIDGYNNRKY